MERYDLRTPWLGAGNPERWGEKPAGMRWRIFERLTAEPDAVVETTVVGMIQKFGLLRRLRTGDG
jgi:hypothetical protein